MKPLCYDWSVIVHKTEIAKTFDFLNAVGYDHEYMIVSLMDDKILICNQAVSIDDLIKEIRFKSFDDMLEKHMENL